MATKKPETALDVIQRMGPARFEEAVQAARVELGGGSVWFRGRPDESIEACRLVVSIEGREEVVPFPQSLLAALAPKEEEGTWNQNLFTDERFEEMSAQICEHCDDSWLVVITVVLDEQHGCKFATVMTMKQFAMERQELAKEVRRLVDIGVEVDVRVVSECYESDEKRESWKDCLGLEITDDAAA